MKWPVWGVALAVCVAVAAVGAGAKAAVVVVAVAAVGRWLLEGVRELAERRGHWALRGARVSVQSVCSAGDDPGRRKDGFAPAGQRMYYAVDVMIAPQRRFGRDVAWAPGELVLVAADLVESAELFEVDSYSIWQDGAFAPDSRPDGLWVGEQRVRLLAGLAPSIKEYRLVYFGHAFGLIRKPR